MRQGFPKNDRVSPLGSSERYIRKNVDNKKCAALKNEETK